MLSLLPFKVKQCVIPCKNITGLTEISHILLMCTHQKKLKANPNTKHSQCNTSYTQLLIVNSVPTISLKDWHIKLQARKL